MVDLVIDTLVELLWVITRLFVVPAIDSFLEVGKASFFGDGIEGIGGTFGEVIAHAGPKGVGLEEVFEDRGRPEFGANGDGGVGLGGDGVGDVAVF